MPHSSLSLSSGRRALCAAALAALFVAPALHAATAPIIFARGHVNGRFNVIANIDSVSGYKFQVQVKDPAAEDDAWADVPFTLYQSNFYNNNYNGRNYHFETNLVGVLAVRARNVSTTDATDASDWVDVGVVTGYVRTVGTRVASISDPSNAFDGNMVTMIDLDGNPWLGYKFDKPLRIRGIRHFARPDGYPNGACFSRYVNSTFQYANDDVFTAPVEFFKVSAENTGVTHVNEYWFPEPITAKAIRHVSASNGRSSITEFEVIPADNPYAPSTPEIGWADLTNLWPAISWTVPKDLYATEVRVLRSTSASRGFAPVTDWFAPTTAAFTNDAAYGEQAAPIVSVGYYYCIEAKSAHPSFPGSVVTSEVSTVLRRLRRLDRDWSDETKLLDGLTVMTATNGAAKGYLPRAFDGDKSTFVDAVSEECTHGPLGLDFGENVWVDAVGYVCRSDNYCHVRVKLATIQCASGDDVELRDKVVCSTKFTESSQDTTLYLKRVDLATPVDGARQWFLYADEEAWYCNVAELMFFGYTASDVLASGVLVAPATVEAVRIADGTGVQVSWYGAANAERFRVERRPRGDDAADWTAAGTVDSPAQTFRDATVTQDHWVYRIVALRGADAEEKSAISPTCECTYYVPASGTGLKGVCYWPYRAGSVEYPPTDRLVLADGAVNCAATGDEPLFPGLPVEKVWYTWRGKIRAPFDGSYTFKLETTDGGCLRIGGVVVNTTGYWTGGSKTGSGVIDLKAGEDVDIEVDARLQQNFGSDGRKCRLSWSGPVDEEIVPASQLFPAENEDPHAFGAYRFHQFGGNVLGKAATTATSITLYGPYAAGNTRDNLAAACLLRGWTNSFDVCAKLVRVSNNGTCGFFVRSADGDVLEATTTFNYRHLTYALRNLAAESENGALTTVVSSTVTYGKDDTYVQSLVYLRLNYDALAHVFTLYYRDAPADDWIEVGAFNDDGSFGRVFDLGFVVTGDGNISYMPVPLCFEEIELKKRPQGTALIVR